MTEKIFHSIMLAVGCVLLASVIIIMGCLYDYFGGVQISQLKDELSLAAVGVETSGEAYLQAISQKRTRLTWIAPDGSVLYDGQADADTMENHGQREEVRMALETGEGTSQRYSGTLMEKTMYCAKRLSDSSVLRISASTASMGLLAFGMIQPVCIVLVIVMVLAFFLAKRLSKRIVEPLNKLDLDHPDINGAYKELVPLLIRLHQQRLQIDTQLRELQQKKTEFEQITANMNEGLVLLNGEGRILSMNPSAKKLFYTEEEALGQSFLSIESGERWQNAMEQAKRQGHSDLFLERKGREYQIDLSRIASESGAEGLVLLSFDATEKRSAERSRREFTANVSHELKTPLTAILGSSEILENGMVKAEDIPRFAGHIHKEAARLLALIEDILRLSRLDEGVEIPTETVQLEEIAAQAVEQLREKARQSNVTLTLDTEPCPLQGVSRLMHEIAYNLIDNAIKYNREEGTVTVSVTKDGVLTVKDTGIGISPEHQDRVFERFYRADKSRSRQIGGTGLGLSIVKHACLHLGASVALKSEVGKGTEITVAFNKKEA